MSNRLIHSFKPPIKRLVACSLSLLLIGTLLPATIGVHPCKAQAQTKPTTISTLLGISRQDFVSYLTNNKDNYLNTAYKPTWPNPTTYQTGPWWSRGTHPYETSEFNGVSGYGMNCAGFLARVWCDMGLENNALMQRWKNAHPWMWANSETLRETLIALGATHYTFASKADLLASGKLQKGDIVQMASDSGIDDHVGIFWGESSSDDRFWHSIFDQNSSTTGRNKISEIYGKMTSGTYYLFKFDEQGWFKLWKESDNKALTQNNACYSLAGATFGVYASESDAHNDSNRITTLETKAHPDYAVGSWGYAESPWLAPATYFVKELTPAKGYGIPSTNPVKSVTVSASEEASTSLTFDDPPKAAPIKIAVNKIDSATKTNTAQGDAQLSGAEFVLSYYDDIYKTADEALQSGKPTRTWIIKTNKDGEARLDETCFVSGDKFYYNKANEVVVPLGTLLIQERKAPSGYELPSGTKPLLYSITDTTSLSETAIIYHAPTVADNVIRGGVKVAKLDKESHESSPLGGASLDETTFEITLASNKPVYVDKIKYQPGDVVKTITTKNGIAQTPADCLPFATYTIAEVSTGQGYKLTDTSPRTFSITKPGVIVEPFATQQAFENQVKRGDLKLIKVGEGSMKRLGHVPFQLTSKTTGESHILITDENGALSTHASWNAHTHNTNANDNLDEDSFDEEAGTWFGLTQNGTITEPDDALGALPFDTYQLTELHCQANANYQLVTIDDIVIKKDMYTIDLGTVIDNAVRPPEISTYAYDEVDEDKLLSPTTDAIVLDTVFYENLQAGKSYLLKASLHVVETDEDEQVQVTPVIDANGNAVEINHVFLATSAQGTTQVPLTFDATRYRDKTIVVYEELFDKQEDRPLAAHTDPLDPDQQVTIMQPKIQTEASDAIDHDSIVSAETQVSIEDEVSYTNLVPHKSYELNGTLMLKETGEPLTNEAGIPITAKQTFTPEAPNGSISLVFTFDAALLAGKTLVAFETLSHNGQEIAIHADIDDINQTVEVREPSLISFASDLQDGAKALKLGSPATLVDLIHYDNLTPPDAVSECKPLSLLPTEDNLISYPIYLAVGILIDKETGKPLALDPQYQSQVDAFYERFQHVVDNKAQNSFTMLEELLNEYTPCQTALPICVKSFTPEQTKGTVEMQFELPETLHEDKELVIFQYVYKLTDEKTGSLVAVDADLKNENQMVALISPPQEQQPPAPLTPEEPQTPKSPEPPLPNTSTTPLAKTGDSLFVVAGVAVVVICLAGITLLVLCKKKRGTFTLPFALILMLGVCAVSGASLIQPSFALADEARITICQGSVFDAPKQGIVLDSRRVFDISKAEFSTTNPAQLGIRSCRIDREPLHQTYRGIAYLGTPPKETEITLAGTASLLWIDIGTDAQGDRVDVEITLSDITLLNKTSNDKEILLLTEVEGLGVLEAQAITNTGICGNSKTFSLNVYKTGTNTPASGCFLMGIRDLDIADRTNGVLPNYLGKYAESIQLMHGFEPDIYINDSCFLSIDASRALFKPTKEDLASSYDSGFVVALDTAGASFSWAGAACGTVVFDQFESHNIIASANQGGTISNPGITRVGWKNDKTYTITPDEHHEIDDVIVDGISQGALSEYTFTHTTTDHEIVASFKPIMITVDFTDGLDTMLSHIKIPKGTCPTPPNPPQRNGYLFDSWDKPIEQLFANTTINALWKPIVYYVTYESNGGEGEMTNQTFTFDETAPLDPCMFTKSGHSFEGWIDEKGDFFENEALVSNLASNDQAIVTLVAQWEDAPAIPEQEKPYAPQDPVEPIEPAQPEEPFEQQPDIPQPPNPDTQNPEIETPRAPSPVKPQDSPETKGETNNQDIATKETETPPQTPDEQTETETLVQDEEEPSNHLPQTSDETLSQALLLALALTLVSTMSIALFAHMRLSYHRKRFMQ